MKHPVLSALIAGAMLAGPAFAQTATDSPATETAPAAKPAPSAAPAETMEPAGDAAPATTTAPAPSDDPASAAMPSAAAGVPEGYMVTELASVTADQLKGIDIHDSSDSKIAEIADLQIGDGDKVTGVITDVGGFLGIGEHRVLLSPEQITVYKNADEALLAYVSLTKDELKAMPKYEAPAQ